jgi:hypothetical protein
VIAYNAEGPGSIPSTAKVIIILKNGGLAEIILKIMALCVVMVHWYVFIFSLTKMHTLDIYSLFVCLSLSILKHYL